MDTFGDRLKHARIVRGYKRARDACERFGWNISTYQQHENGTRGAKDDAKIEYAEKFHVSLSWLMKGDGPSGLDHIGIDATNVGGGELRPTNVERLHVRWVAEAGAWREADIYDDEPEAFSVVMSESHPGIPRFLVKVAGDSAVDLKIFDGDYVVCVEWIALEGRMSDGQVVVVQQTDGHRIETTIKVLKLFKDHYELQPRSPNPKHKPIVVHPGDGEADGRNVEIIGLVESLHRPIGRG